MGAVGSGDLFGLLHRLGDRFPVRIGRCANVGLLAAERRDLRLAQFFTALDQPIINRARPPVDLVDGPWDHGWLAQRFHTLRIVAAERFGERSASSDKLAKRGVVQLVDLRVEGGQLRMRNGERVRLRNRERADVEQEDAVPARVNQTGQGSRIRGAERVLLNRLQRTVTTAIARGVGEDGAEECAAGRR